MGAGIALETGNTPGSNAAATNVTICSAAWRMRIIGGAEIVKTRIVHSGNDTADGIVGAAICRLKIMNKENGRLVAAPTFLNSTSVKFERKTAPGEWFTGGDFCLLEQ